MSDRSVTPGDLDLLREILDLGRIPPGLTPPSALDAVLERVRRLIGCDGIVFHVMDGVHRRVHYGQELLDDGRAVTLTPEQVAAMATHPAVELLWERWWTSRCSLPERSRQDMVATVRTWYGEREWAEHWLHHTCTPADDQFLLGYPTGRGSSMRIMANREHGSPYGTREIGRSLRLSEATVRKHLEHIYERLGVLNRTQAVRAYFGSVGVGGAIVPGAADPAEPGTRRSSAVPSSTRSVHGVGDRQVEGAASAG